MTAYFAPARTETFTTPETTAAPIDETTEAHPHTEAFFTTEAESQPMTECPATMPTHSLTPLLSCFRTELSAFGMSTEMTFIGALTPSPADFVLYHAADESFTEQASPPSGEGMHCYVFEDAGGTVYRVMQTVREEFSFRYERGSRPEPVTIAGHAGMLLLPQPGEMPYSALYWDDGSYTFSMTAWEAKPERMQALAESLVPVSQASETGKEESP